VAIASALFDERCSVIFFREVDEKLIALPFHRQSKVETAVQRKALAMMRANQRAVFGHQGLGQVVPLVRAALRHGDQPGIVLKYEHRRFFPLTVQKYMT
jgi:hypothetical protein